MIDVRKPTMTCSEDAEKFLALAGDVKNILWSPKLDGVRCWAVVYQCGKVEYLSRNKKNFDNFGCFDEPLKELARKMRDAGTVDSNPMVFDGEVIAKNFSKVMTQLRRLKDVDNSIFKFAIFDYLGGGDINFICRCNNLRLAFRDSGESNVSLLQHYIFPVEATTANVIRLQDSMVKLGYEGIVLKTADSKCEHKRSGQWCKVKPTYTMDVRVLGIEMGGGKHEGKMGALKCGWKGGIVSVGGGYSDLERAEFLTNIPSIIEVEYQELTGEPGKQSMRFPRFIRVRDDKDEICEVVNG